MKRLCEKSFGCLLFAVGLLILPVSARQSSIAQSEAPQASYAQLQPQPVPPQPPIGAQERAKEPKAGNGARPGDPLPQQPPLGNQMDITRNNFDFQKLLRNFGIK